MLEHLRENSRMQKRLREYSGMTRREFFGFIKMSGEIAAVLAASAGIPATVTAMETGYRYFRARRLAEMQAKQLKRQTGFKRTRPRHLKEEITYRRRKEQKLTESDVVHTDRESPAPERQATGRSEDSRNSLTTFFLDTRPPEALRGYADSAIITSEGRRRWKQQEWFPLREADMPTFEGKHDAETYSRIVNHFNVDDPLNMRYAATSGTTFCNIFAWDVSRAMDVEIPRWIDGEKTWTNSIYEWLSDPLQGKFLGWETVEPYSAQEKANKGYPVVVMTVPHNGRLGHMAMVIPGPGEIVNRTFYPLIAQAGLTNFVGKSVYASQQFRDREVEYFVNQTSGYRFAVPREAGSSLP